MQTKPALPRAEEGPTLGQALLGVLKNPYRNLLLRWNWKSAVTSSVVRAAIFFAVNLKAGQDAAITAFTIEFIYRAVTSGFYGSFTQALSEVRPNWQGVMGALVLLPIANHALEFVAHWAGGTEKLWLSILVSMCFTAISSSFHVFVMRRGLLTVGHGSQGLIADLIQMPKAVFLFITWPFTALWGALSASASPERTGSDEVSVLDPER
ncbi:MAG: hypothetical protein GC160_23570 [Acidobacteria bacterium]|nr:hypothetical protein [Acidobacteriota bacterium]